MLSLLGLCSMKLIIVKHLATIVSLAIRRNWLQVAKFSIVHGEYGRCSQYCFGHCMISRSRSLLYQTAHTGKVSQSRDILDFFLSHALAEGKDTVICWLTHDHNLDVDLLEYSLQFWERCYSRGITNLSINEVLQQPKVISSVLRSENPEAILRLLSFHSSRDPLNELLRDFSTDLMSMISYHRVRDGTPGFKHSPQVLKHMLDCGLSPSRGLLVWCALACSANNADNLYLIVHEKSLCSPPFSSTELSFCLDQIFKNHDRWRSHYRTSICNCLTEDYDNTLGAISGWKFFRDHGAACNSAPMLKLAFEAQSSEEYMLIREFLMHGWDPVATAIQSDLTAMLEKLFTLGFSQEDYYIGDKEFELTPIQHAAYSNKPEVLQMLLQRGANINAPARGLDGHIGGMTALQAALYQGHMHIAMDLLRAGADVNAPLGSTAALHYAAASGNLQIVLTLLKAGADVNAFNNTLYPTALHEAAANGHLQIAMELIRAGADINTLGVGEHPETVLEVAAKRGRLDMVYLLMRNYRNQSLLRKDCKGAAQQAKRLGHTVIARLLAQHAQKLAEELGKESEDDIDEPREELEIEVHA